MATMNKLMDDPTEILRNELAKAMQDRQSNEQVSRVKLRDFATQLREPSEPRTIGPASASSPAFKVTQASNYPHVTESGPSQPGSGQLTPAAEREFLTHMSNAARQPDAATRDGHTARAAQTVGKDWDKKHGHTATDNLVHQARHMARAQAVFVAREIGQKIGLNPVESTVVGYSLERALEKEGFKVMASYAIDKASDAYKATSSAVSTAVGLRAGAESSLNKSLGWMAEHGVTKEAMKDVMNKHAGKFMILTELAANPAAVQRASQIISRSDGAVNTVMSLAKDDDLRKAVGTLSMATGEALASSHVGRGAGSVAILAGSALRGDAPSETGRHVFRAAMSIAAGAAGGVALGGASFGVGAIAGAVAGQAAGSALADKMLEMYDKHVGNDRTLKQEPMVSTQERNESAALIGGRAKEAGMHAASDGIKDLAASHGGGGALGGKGAESPGGKDSGMESKVREISREYSMGSRSS